MGAQDFYDVVARCETNTDRKVAFNGLREAAQYDCGHAGYTGTIAEKQEFTFMKLVNEDTTFEEVHEAIDDGFDEVFEKLDVIFGEHNGETAFRRYSDKWGPALCYDTKSKTVFCGL